jgi:hypothetical protein
VDYSLKEGQKISISLGGISKSSAVPKEENADFSNFFIPPPPSSSQVGGVSAWGDASNKEASWDDFGDFSSNVDKKSGWTSFE